jgi:hypothetical protein
MISALVMTAIMFVKFIHEVIKHNKRMKQINKWSVFHQQLSDWANEIEDQNTKYQYMNHCLGLLDNRHAKIHGVIGDTHRGIDYINEIPSLIEKEREDIYKKWGDHIPSLKQQMREIKLNKIL